MNRINGNLRPLINDGYLKRNEKSWKAILYMVLRCSSITLCNYVICTGVPGIVPGAGPGTCYMAPGPRYWDLVPGILKGPGIQDLEFFMFYSVVTCVPL